MKAVLSTLLCLWLCSAPLPAQPPCSYTRADSLCIESALRSEAQTTLDFARLFIDRPYVAHTLEPFDEERVVVNTRQLDCTTFVETVLALKRCRQQATTRFADYVDALQQLRYRGGQLDGYTSRLHYFSDWIDDNSRMGFVAEVQAPNPPFTAVQRLRVNYMSTHPKSYRLLKKFPKMVPTIAQQEQQLTGRTYRYIPKSIVGNSQLLRQAVRDGDVIAITCSKPGLDIAHLGFAVWQADGLHLLNASMIHKKVVLEPLTLYDYLQQHPSHTGIRIVRIREK